MGPKTPLHGRHLGNDFTLKDGFRMYHGKKVPGFPAHPHRGFETITIVEQGFVDHSDSLGATARFAKGDVQWMTAGSGIQHSEMFPLVHQDKPNTLEIFQIWLNLPARSKLVKPHFKMLWSDTLAVIADGRPGPEVRIVAIAGSHYGYGGQVHSRTSWAADPINHVAVFRVDMQPGAAFSLPPAPVGVNRSVYVYDQDLEINGALIASEHVAEMEAGVVTRMKCGSKGAKLLVLQGRPIGEPVVQYGPFVMNSEREIEEAYRDFEKTQWGGWPWPSPDPVHDRNRGRFAVYPDGRVDTPD
jgi:redox-sensitive bicupin YhaK (pirin superfamily)